MGPDIQPRGDDDFLNLRALLINDAAGDRCARLQRDGQLQGLSVRRRINFLNRVSIVALTTGFAAVQEQAADLLQDVAAVSGVYEQMAGAGQNRDSEISVAIGKLDAFPAGLDAF